MATLPPFRAEAHNKGNSTTATLVTPAAVEPDDWGVVVVSSGDGMGNPTLPAGWSVVVPTTAIAAKSRVTVVAKKYVEGDADPSFVFSVGSNWSVAAVWYSGADGVGVVGSFTGSSTGSTSTAAALTTTSAENAVLIIGTHFAGGSGFASAVSSVSPAATQRSLQVGAATFNHAIYIGEVEQAAAGATASRTITWNAAGGGMGGVQVALIPALPPQEWVPTTDTGATIAGWSKTPSGAASVAAVLADSDPATYIESGDNPTGQVWQSEPFDLAKPADMSSVKVKVSGYMPTGTTGDRTIALYQGTTLIKQTSVSLTGSDAETVMALNSTEAGSITVTTGMWEGLSVKVTDTAS